MKTTIAFILGIVLICGMANAELQVTNLAAYSPTAYSGQTYQITATVTNTGTEAATRYIEGCIFPQTWRGMAYPYAAYTAVPATGCCPQNEYCDTKSITLQPGATENILLQPKAPSITSTDACNSLGSAWGSGSPNFDIVVGTASCCRCGYLSYKINSGLTINQQTTTTTICIPGTSGCNKICVYPEEKCVNGKVQKCSTNGDLWIPTEQNCGVTTTTTYIPPTTTIPPVAVCGNNMCETGESFLTCANDCQPSAMIWLIGAIVIGVIILVIYLARKKRR